jgi:UDP-N-acetylglucosamine--N-acetylmuramyl-(pentapeptide) pyrophosphoryl-undecaprenol N-acetylglucosamine transferase
VSSAANSAGAERETADGGVLIMAGGTGGHIYPGLAVARALREAQVPVSWLGAAGGMETRKVPATGIELDVVEIAGLRGKGLVGWLRLPGRLARAVREASAVFRRRRPACAVSFGGYVAGPGGLAARLRGVPLVVHEQNRIPGLTNRVLARLARTVLQAFPDSFPASVGAQTCGNPVRAEVAALAAPGERWAGRQGPARLLVTGGSQGARALNQLVPEALARRPAADRPRVRHQCGERELEETGARYRELGVDAEVTAFIDDMAAAYGWADLVVCRAGALTVSELAAAGVGAVLVPYPHAVDDHQTANARFLVEAGAAVLLAQAGLTAEGLERALAPLLADRRETLRLAQAARAVAVPDAAQAVAQACRAAAGHAGLRHAA